MKVFDSIASDDIMKHFSKKCGKTLMNFAANTCGIEETLAVSSLLCPKIIQEKDYIFISDFYNGGIEEIEQQFQYDKKKIEMFVNSWSLHDFFLLADNETTNNEIVLNEFGKVLQYFWDQRLKMLFPEKNIAVELGDGLMGESGLVITVYEKN